MTIAVAARVVEVGRWRDGVPQRERISAAEQRFGSLWWETSVPRSIADDHQVVGLAAYAAASLLTCCLAATGARPAHAPDLLGRRIPTAGAFDTSGWFVYQAPDGSFEIRMPAQPTTLSTSLTSADWASPYTEAMVLNPGGKTGFTVGWIDYKPSALTGKSPDTILVHGQATQVARITNATIVDQSQILSDGHPGRAWTLKFSGGSAQTRAFIVGVRLYTLQAILAAGDEARGTAFLGSFT